MSLDINYIIIISTIIDSYFGDDYHGWKVSGSENFFNKL